MTRIDRHGVEALTMWDERYAEPGFAYGSEPNDFLVEAAGLLRPGGRILELAAGQGRNGVWLAGRGFDVTCVDASGVGLAGAGRLAAARGVSIRAVPADLASYAIEPGAFDGIVSIFAHFPPSLRAKIHASAALGLSPGGVLILEAYTPAQLAFATGGPKDPTHCMTLASLRAELPGLEVVVGVEREREICEGKYHQGRSAVVQLVARRPG